MKNKKTLTTTMTPAMALSLAASALIKLTSRNTISNAIKLADALGITLDELCRDIKE